MTRMIFFLLNNIFSYFKIINILFKHINVLLKVISFFMIWITILIIINHQIIPSQRFIKQIITKLYTILILLFTRLNFHLSFVYASWLILCFYQTFWSFCCCIQRLFNFFKLSIKRRFLISEIIILRKIINHTDILSSTITTATFFKRLLVWWFRQRFFWFKWWFRSTRR